MEQTIRHHINGKSYVILFLLLVLMIFLVMAKGFKAESYEQYKTVTVEKGDTLWALANSNKENANRSVNGFIEWVERVNHIERHHIEPGQKLIIPVENK
ncbi:LysM domain-containing protein [Scopulibacillus darangshiensis]|uniref:LysM domain-containing protein n=1 Tax=Scopulibacillus darangshiensis TaxID=442528 RepID=A0A4R2P7Q2_9BACL|nr:LysM peptidoglycan-binding domain-containing protein [Scopulibacillus darangshiensis]TCP30234.1 LysM domain-containing protein [Scopulibacillus darangshiensis]